MDVRNATCFSTNNRNGTFGRMDLFCELEFDGLLCWPATKAGQLAVQACPFFYESNETATKKCEETGRWFVNPETNNKWANYSLCQLHYFTEDTALINKTEYERLKEDLATYAYWIPKLKMISSVGYCVSLITLLICVVIFLSIPKLRCARNNLHVHLFISFIMKALMTIIKNLSLISGVAFDRDVLVDGQHTYLTENYHWSCKAVVSAKYYFTQANYMFILMEGVYLHNLMFTNIFSEKSSIRCYYLFGWGVPLVFITIWVKLRATFDNDMCWTRNQNKYIGLLTQLPIEISIVINFILFMSIIRILCVKINSVYLQQRKVKYIRLIRSTLTLMLIYEVPFTLSIIASYSKDRTVELIWLFADQTFCALQGFFMALIYCLLNTEVRNELIHKYRSIRDKRQQRRTRTISNNTQCIMQDTPFCTTPACLDTKDPYCRTQEHFPEDPYANIFSIDQHKMIKNV